MCKTLGGVLLVNSVNEKSIFFTGYAKLPASITAEKLYAVIAVGVEVDPDTGVIIECDCTLATQVGKNFFRKLTKGYCLNNGIDDLVQQLETRYYGSARKAIITALRIMYDRWLTFKENQD